MDDNAMNKQCGVRSIMWWATLVVAVIAVPTLGFAFVTVSGTHGMMQIAIFMFTCWLCTYLGMKLMQTPSMSKKIDIKK